MDQVRQSEMNISSVPSAAEAGLIPLDAQQVQRIRRIGKRLLRVANCLIALAEDADKPADGERSMESIEAQFSNSVPISGIPVYVPDARADRFLSTHRQVVGAPYIRFFASYPIRNTENAVIGNIRLLDYSPRVLSDEEKQSLSDIAVLVEREFQLSATNASRMELMKKNWNLRRESMIDPLVGTWNRTAITRLLKQEIEQCRKDEKPVSVVLADVDAFKKINEAHGRGVGDLMLQKLASRLRSCIRPHDTLGRYEGGKFMIILPGADHLVAKLVADRLNNAIRTSPEKAGEATISITICSGTVSSDKFPSAGADELISRANTALSTAQKMGHNSIAQAVPPAT
ncbi:MAG: sensor diguanylate cyclase [Burkholderiaceae bacterium]|nr:sensor diguanylate cyclase [Burkholderiaceae bacterium]